MKRLIGLFLLGLGLLIPHNVWSAAISSTASGGLWSSSTTWTGGVVPGVLCSTDTVTIVAGSTVTWDGTYGGYTIGTGVAANVALQINGCFNIPYDCPTSTITLNGICNLNDGQTPPSQCLVATESTPYLSTNTFRWYHGDSTNNRFYTFLHRGTNSGSWKWYGNFYQNQYTTTTYYARTINDVTTSSNSVRLDTDIQAKVGQEYAIACTEGIQQTRIMTVAAYNASTPSMTFTNNFEYSYSSGTTLALISNNLIFGATNNLYSGFFQKEYSAGDTSALSVDLTLKHVTFRNNGTTGTGFVVTGLDNIISSCAFVNNGLMQLTSVSSSTVDNVVISSNSANNIYGLLNTGVFGITFNRIFFIMNNVASGVNNTALWEKGVGNTWNNCFFSGARKAGRFAYADIILNNYITQCLFDSEWDNYDGVYTSPVVTFNNGTYRQLAKTPIGGTNIPVSNLSTQAGYPFNYTYNNSYSYISSTPTASAGMILDNLFTSNSLFKVQSFNNIIGTNRVYTAGHSIVMTDTTTIHTVGNSALQYNLGWSTSYKGYNPTSISFNIPCNANNTILFRGYALKNSNYGSATLPYVNIQTNDGLVNLTTTMTDSNNAWQLLTTGGTTVSSGTVTVYMVAQSTIANSVMWFDDCRLYIGDSVYSLGQKWLSGFPVASPVASTIDASNVWNASTTTFTTSGSFGQVVGTNLNAPISGISISSTSIANGVWDAILMTSHTITNSAGKIIKEIRRREP